MQANFNNERQSVLWSSDQDPFYGNNITPFNSTNMDGSSAPMNNMGEYTFQPIRTSDDEFFGRRASHARNTSFDMVDINYNSGGSTGNSRPTSPITATTGRSTSPLMMMNQIPSQKNKQNSLEPVIDEIPLLEELGINFRDIWNRSLFVLNPFSNERRRALNSMMNANNPSFQQSRLNSEEASVQHLLKDMDLAGPLMFCIALGFTLLLKGKIHFNYIYGVVVIGCLSIYVLLNLMCPLKRHIELQHCISIMGYGLLPMVFLGLFTTFLPFPILGLVLSWLAIFWSSYGASTMFVAALGMAHQRMLVSYPVGLVYATFALITVM
ncbi:hypothetical protein C9374_008957 [Naegleria lovaniensis]|uniref:Protein YIPF n=1 Tax=Naegleria lovaniensis TaxID=51637 RepID=A0AA88GEA3_NAELO|nr:uncharacterized protein C9374_008957 [Naegleria lovaniensis]KAG2377872.1 hypothetical protein C9374_008957 [Naegleria lovaniensis]